MQSILFFSRKTKLFITCSPPKHSLVKAGEKCYTVIGGGTQPPKAFSISSATASVKWSWFREATAWKRQKEKTKLILNIMFTQT